jgi:hypothetical protein
LFTAVDAAMLRLATQPVSSGGQHGWPDLNAPPASQVNQWKSWMEGVWADTVFTEAVSAASPDLARRVTAILSGRVDRLLAVGLQTHRTVGRKRNEATVVVGDAFAQRHEGTAKQEKALERFRTEPVEGPDNRPIDPDRHRDFVAGHWRRGDPPFPAGDLGRRDELLYTRREPREPRSDGGETSHTRPELAGTTVPVDEQSRERSPDGVQHDDAGHPDANPVERIRLVTTTEAAARFLTQRARIVIGREIDLDVQVRREGDV